MPTQTSTLRAHRAGPTLTVRVEGRATMHQSVPLRRHAEQLLAQGVSTVHVDLSGCTYMDSTFLGTLLALLRSVRQRGQGAFALVSPSPQCHRLLYETCLEDVYPVCDASVPESADWHELGDAPADVETFRCNVVQAHQQLADLPGPAGDAFREVARGLTESMEAARAGPGGPTKMSP